MQQQSMQQMQQVTSACEEILWFFSFVFCVWLQQHKAQQDEATRAVAELTEVKAFLIYLLNHIRESVFY